MEFWRLRRMPVTTIAPLSLGIFAFGPGGVDGCVAFGSPGVGVASVASGGGGTCAAGSVPWARAWDGSAAPSSDEQHPPAKSKARRERSEWVNKSLPCLATSAPSIHGRLPYPYGSASNLVLES